MKIASRFVVLAVLALSISSAMADSPIRSGDSFEIRIGGVPGDDQQTISTNYTVDGEGYLNMPYIGKVMVAHLTASAIQSSIEHAYVAQGIFTHPTITLNMATARFVNVGGEVRSPSRVPYTDDMTVLSAINAAGDFTEYAKPSDVWLTRDGKVMHVNCAKARKNPSFDVKVQPGDQIRVQQSFW